MPAHWDATPGVYLVKDSDDLISHCQCEEALVTYPGQASCPWCGCGWLFSCIECRKSFTFARAVPTDLTWKELALRDIRRGGWDETPYDIDDWIRFVKDMVACIELGQRYVFFDGAYIPAGAGSIRHEGWYASHELPTVPQTAALTHPSIVDEVLKNRSYWLTNAHPRSE